MAEPPFSQETHQGIFQLQSAIEVDTQSHHTSAFIVLGPDRFGNLVPRVSHPRKHRTKNAAASERLYGPNMFCFHCSGDILSESSSSSSVTVSDPGLSASASTLSNSNPGTHFLTRDQDLEQALYHRLRDDNENLNLDWRTGHNYTTRARTPAGGAQAAAANPLEPLGFSHPIVPLMYQHHILQPIRVSTVQSISNMWPSPATRHPRVMEHTHKDFV